MLTRKYLKTIIVNLSVNYYQFKGSVGVPLNRYPRESFTLLLYRKIKKVCAFFYCFYCVDSYMVLKKMQNTKAPTKVLLKPKNTIANVLWEKFPRIR